VSDELNAAWAAWCDRLKAVGASISQQGFPQDERDRAEGFRWLTRLMVHATQMELEAGDPRFPLFVRYETPTNQWGGPNPDNVYLRANIDPEQAYRVWADAAGMRQVIVSLHEGDMQLGEFGVYGEHSLDQLELDAHGQLELRIGGERAPGNWIPMDPKARILTIRIYQSDWERDTAPVFHIERIGAEGVPPGPLRPEQVTRALDRAAHWVEKTAVFWNGYTSRAWDQSTPNVPAAPRSTPGGADNILYGSCFWELDEDQILLLECEVPDAQYWGFTIHTLGWLESGHFADRQTSLSQHQVHRDGDGRIRVAVAPRDPGVPNWIDTEGRPRGMLVYRWVWARSNPEPSGCVVSHAELRSLLPDDHPTVDAKARRQALARRREAAWNRFL
jgi:hypothetical protein